MGSPSERNRSAAEFGGVYQVPAAQRLSVLGDFIQPPIIARWPKARRGVPKVERRVLYQKFLD
jgi:hypothetical protein